MITFRFCPVTIVKQAIFILPCILFIYCNPSFVRGVLISRFLDQVLIHGVLYSREAFSTPYFMYKMHVIDLFAAFYIRQNKTLANERRFTIFLKDT